MSFDAGSIIARLDLDDDAFDRKLREDVAKVEAFEKASHEVKITPEVDKAGAARVRHDIEQIDRQVTTDAHRRGGLLSMLTKMFSSSGTGGPGGASGTAAFHRNLLAAAGPGIAGIGAKAATIGAAIPLGLGALPALTAPLLAGGVGAAGIGVAALGAKELIGTKQQKGPLYAAGTAAAKDFTQGLRDAAGPMLEPLRRVLGQVPQIMRQIMPAMRAVFAGAATLIQPVVHGITDLIRMIGPGLGQAFRAAAPLMRPLLDGLGQLVRGLLPGVVSLLRAAHPAITVFAQILGVLGRNIGSMLRDFAPVLRQSSVIFKALMDVVSALFPIIGRLAAIFARALAPVFVQFASVIRSLLPFLVTLGRVLAGFAAAVIKDLASALGAVAVLLRDLSPSFRILAAVLGRVFTIMENAGVFQTLANALYQIAPVLARFINTLIRQLAPDLPVIIKLVSQLATILVDMLAAGLGAVLSGVTYLIQHFGPLIKWLALATLADYAFGVALAFVAANPVVAIIGGIVLLIGAIVLLVKHWHQVWGEIKRIAMDAWTFLTHGWGQALLPGLTLIRWTVQFVRDHWKQAWDAILHAAEDAWNFLTHGWGQFLIPQLYVIRKVVEFVRDHWRQAWDDMVSIGRGAWHVLHDDVLAPLINFFTNSIPDAFRASVRAIGTAWDNIKNVVRAPVAWVVDHVIDGLISAFDWISGKVGGPHIPAVHPFGLQRGGRVPGYGGGDQHPALLEGGEVVVPKEEAGGLAWLWKMLGIPGYQSGGRVPAGRFPGLAQPKPGSAPFGGGVAHNIGHAIGSAAHALAGGGKIMAALATGNTTALMNAIKGMIPGGVGGATGDLAGLLLAIPKKLLGDALHFLIHKAASVLSAPFHGQVGAGVAQWRPDVIRVLSMLGLSPGLANQVLYQMNTESGGNPNAINLTDSNAQAGDPSRGLLQTIGSTFAAYAGPFRGRSIYDPLANIYAAVNYAMHRYGRTLISGGMGMGSGHGYDRGGWLEPGGLNRTGQREAVLNPAQSSAFLSLAEAVALSARGRPAGTGLESRLDRLIRAVERSAATTGQAVGDALNGAARSASYRASYSVR